MLDFHRIFEQAGFAMLDGKATNVFQAKEIEEARKRLIDRFRGRSVEELSTASYWGWWRRS